MLLPADAIIASIMAELRNVTGREINVAVEPQMVSPEERR
jgi:hypothetical protein